MAQTYKMMLGTSGKQWELLTVKDDGRMVMTFHGTDREICHEVTENADGWLCYPGAMFPGLESGRWKAVGDVQGTVPAVGSEAESERTTEGLSPMCAEPAVPVESALRGQAPCNPEPAVTVESALRGQTPCNPPSTTHTGDSPREPRPRRQRKPRKPRVERQEPITVNPEPLTVNHQPSSTLKAVGMVAAATVALFVIYETGLLIPLGLIGLATGGILK